MTKRPQTQTGTKAIRATFKSAQRQLADTAPVDDPDPNQPRGGIAAGEWDGFPHDKLPPDCPVHVIGRDVEGTLYALTATNDLRRVERYDHVSLIDLFAPYVNFAYWAWPAKGEVEITDADGSKRKTVRVKRLERDKAATCLINAASRRPLFDPSRQHRGRGGWKDSQERFIWHSGSALWSVNGTSLERAKPAEHDGFLYTRQPSTIEPWEAAVTAEESPARRILEDLRTWKWERPYLDPVLCLGWIGTAFYGGALDTRPIVFTAGGAGVGKSTLHELFKKVLNGAVISFADTTAAGIYQKVKQDSLMVMVDELEAKPGSSRPQAIIDLARIAYTGAEMGRGGADHEGVTFQLRNSFFFSAIQPPAMGEADKSRMAFLNLDRLDHTDGLGRKVNVSIDTDGRMILRQMMDGWPQFRRLLAGWWDVLQSQGLDSRTIDTYGPLLAAAEMMVGGEVLEAIGLPVAETTRLGEIIAHATALDRADRVESWHQCINRLLDSTVEAWRDGAKPTVGGVLDQLVEDTINLEPARERLALANLSVQLANGARRRPLLAVPNNGPALERIYQGTRFEAGGWTTALRQCPRSLGIVLERDAGGKNVKINGRQQRCLMIDIVALNAWIEKGDG